MKGMIVILMLLFNFHAFAQILDYSRTNTNDLHWKHMVLYNIANILRDKKVDCVGKYRLQGMINQIDTAGSSSQTSSIQIEQKKDHILMILDYTYYIRYSSLGNSYGRTLVKFTLSLDAKTIKSFTYQEGGIMGDCNCIDTRELSENILQPAGTTTQDTLRMKDEITTCNVIE